MSQWDLSPFYSSVEAWEEDLKKLPAHIEHLASFKGKLSDLQSFRAFYVAEEETNKLMYRLYGYIHLASDLNLKDTVTSSKNQQLMLMFSDLGQKTSFVAPELIAMGEEKVMSFVQSDDFLKT